MSPTPRRTLLHLATINLALSAAPAAAEWKRALPGWDYAFPRDHYAHPEFKTEWWYFTGHLESENGRRFGYQITFFRQGVIPPGEVAETSSRFVRPAFHFGHFAISDLDRKEFLFDQRVFRGAFDESGDETDPGSPTIAWLGEWKLVRNGSAFACTATMDGAELALQLEPRKPITINGSEGVSRKSPGPGNATHYYSITRLASSGTLKLDGEELKVTGESWFDREWGTNQLAPDQVGWDWFSIHFSDGAELMVYRLRTAEGETHPSSGGTYVDARGEPRTLERSDLRLAPGRTWTSKVSGGRYPVAWNVQIPSLEIDIEVSASFANQELNVPLISYWEGSVDIRGAKSGVPSKGRGYLEMTGYSGPLRVLE